MSETTTITVEAAAQGGDNYGIKSSDGTWYNLSQYADNQGQLQERQRGLDSGDTVKLKLDQEGSTYYEALEIVDSGSNGGGGASASETGGGGVKARRIGRQVALKAAARTHHGSGEAVKVLETADEYVAWLREEGVVSDD